MGSLGGMTSLLNSLGSCNLQLPLLPQLQEYQELSKRMQQESLHLEALSY